MMTRFFATVAALLLSATPALAQLGSVPNVFTSGTTISSANVNTNFSTAYANALNRTGGIMTGTLTTLAVLPTADNVSDIGSAALSYNDGWFDGTLTVATLSVTTSTLGVATATTLDTGFGANELYDMDQHVLTTAAVTFATVDTGQGANELYDMDQNVLTTSSPTFADITTGSINRLTTLTANQILYASASNTEGASANLTYDGTTFTVSNTASNGSFSTQGNGLHRFDLYDVDAADEPNISFRRAKGATVAAAAIVVDGDALGGFRFRGFDGVDINATAASISAVVDGTPGADDMPGALLFSTSADGTETPLERLRVKSTGVVGIGTGATVSAWLHVLGTTEQLRLGYDASNYLSVTVGSAGATVFNATGAGATFTFSDTASFNLGIYERSRSVLMGEWQNQAFAAGDYTASSGTWTVDSGDVLTNRYTLVGKTVTWQVVVDATDVSATPLTLRIALPTGVTDATGLVRWGSCGTTANAGAQTVPALWSIADTGAVYIYRYDLSNWSTTSSDNTGVSCTIIFETD